MSSSAHTDIGEMTAVELLEHYARKTVSPVEATKAALDRIDRYNPVVNAYCHVDPEAAMSAALASERRWRAGTPYGPLDGVPSSIKDLTLTAGMPTRKGSRTTNPDGPWSIDAPFTARMREAGAVLLGKTTTPEFGWKGVTDNPLYGITRNPWNPKKTAGGSSGGAGAAAALNMGVLHQGSDAGGSIRIPCAFTGTFGIKSTFGLVPQWPASAMTTLSHLGPMTRTVTDSALMLSVVSQPDDRDSYAVSIPRRDWTVGLNDGVRGMRIAYSRGLGYVTPDPDVVACVDRAVAILADLGAQVEEVDPGFANPVEVFNTLWFAGAAKALSLLTPEQRDLVDPGFREIAEVGAKITIVDYMKAMDARAALCEQMAAFHQSYDLLVTPAVPITAFDAGRNTPQGSAMDNWVSWTPYSYPFNMTQQPAASFPCGLSDKTGLPVGLHVVGGRYQDDMVMRACRAVEAVLPPPICPSPI